MNLPNDMNRQLTNLFELDWKFVDDNTYFDIE